MKYTVSDHITDSVDVHIGNDVWFFGAYMYNIMFQVLKMVRNCGGCGKLIFGQIWMDEYDKIVALERK